MDKAPVSVVVIAKNEEKRLADCLKSAAFAQEIIVLDDPSCKELLSTFIHEHPELWHEDIGL